ncbi:Ankyrin repeat domain-containing protein 10 [Nymphon striatum]|nr:Ankyrin repeat domain-containing protein 10 [Nymphon striatum]
MQEDTIVSHRIICDHVTTRGGILTVPLTKELLQYASGARMRYRAHLDSQKLLLQKNEVSRKRKALASDLESVRKKFKSTSVIVESLKQDADRYADIAEAAIGTKMAEAITKSNTFRKHMKEKKKELLTIEEDINPFSFDCVKILMAVTAIGICADISSKYKHVPLHLAAFQGNARIVECLLTITKYCDMLDHLGETPLHKAVRSGSTECLSLLISNGADLR